MPADSSLSHRFVAGSNNRWTLPAFWERDFLVGMPRDVSALKRTGSDLARTGAGILNEMSDLRAALSEQHGELVFALNDIGYAIESVESAVKGMGEGVIVAIGILEQSLSLHLSEVRWLLGRTNDHLSELIGLVRFPRQTEAAELVQDAMLALSAGHVEDAEDCLRQALERKPTNPEAHLNLGYLNIRKGDASAAVLHFRKAADYTSSKENIHGRILALENLARTHYAAGDHLAAANTMETVLELRVHGNAPPSRQLRYHFGVYLALSGQGARAIPHLIELCKEDAVYTALVGTDADLECVRRELLTALNSLTMSEHRDAERRYKTACELLEKCRQSGHCAREWANVVRILRKCPKLLGLRSYHAALEAKSLLAGPEEVLKQLPNLVETRIRFLAGRENEETLRDAILPLQQRAKKAREEVDRLRAEQSTSRVPGIGEFVKLVSIVLAVVAFFAIISSTSSLVKILGVSALGLGAVGFIWGFCLARSSRKHYESRSRVRIEMAELDEASAAQALSTAETEYREARFSGMAQSEAIRSLEVSIEGVLTRGIAARQARIRSEGGAAFTRARCL